MNNDERKKAILNVLMEKEEPITGSELAKIFNVTRQIIVQDIALLRAEKLDITSMSRGYVLVKNISNKVRETVKVCHSSEKIEDELKIIVDLGGCAVSTFIEHPFYGSLGEALNIKSRKDINNFMLKIKESGCEPLLSLTNGIHTHIIEADDYETINEICDELKKRGYLITS